MKKIILGLFVLSFFFFGINTIKKVEATSVGPICDVSQLTSRLEEGMSGPQVTILQTALTALLSYTGVINGNFDYGTRFSVTNFQHYNGLPRDGIVGNETIQMLNKRCIGGPVSIKVISPTRGQLFKIGDTVEIKWTSENLPVGLNVGVSVSDGTHNSRSITAINNGKVNYKLDDQNLREGHFYKVKVRTFATPIYPSVEDYSDDNFTIVSADYVPLVKIDGGWTPWVNSGSCVDGLQTQTRKCTNPIPSGGGVCYGRDIQEVNCATPINGGWSPWVDSGDCINGYKTQTHTCTNPAPANGGAFCAGDSTKTISCTSPVNGAWSPWVDSSACGVNGYKTQTRTCTNPAPANGGASCAGDSTKTISCTSPVNGAWSPWVDSGDCINGYKTQTHTCTNPAPANGGASCTGASTQQISCSGPSVPIVSSPIVSSITTNSAKLSATLTSLGNPASVSSRGICYKANGNASRTGTTSTCVDVSLSSTATGAFSITPNNLLPNTSYTFIGYAYNAYGLGVTSSLGSFTTLGTTNTSPITMAVSLDSSSPINQTITAGSGNVTFAKIKITAGSQSINNLGAIQIASDLPNSTKLNSLAIYDGNTKIGSTNSGLVYNGIYYYSWVYLNSNLSIPANTSKVLSIIADTSPVGSQSFFSGGVRLGVAGWNFDSTSATNIPVSVVPNTAIYGNIFTVTSSSTTTPSITVLSPNGGETYTAGQQVTVTWKTENYTGNIAEINLVPLDMKYGTRLTFDKEIPNTGSYVANLPSISDNSNGYYSWGKNFKMEVIIFGGPTNSEINDLSDNTFTINSSNITPDPGCLPGYRFNPTTGEKCYITNTDACLPGQIYNPRTGVKCSSDNSSAWSNTSSGNYNSSCSSNLLTQKLRVGSTGSEVQYLQSILVDLGFLDDNGVDGKFGKGTRSAVVAFQYRNGLVGDGIVGVRTRSLLNNQLKERCLITN